MRTVLHKQGADLISDAVASGDPIWFVGFTSGTQPNDFSVIDPLENTDFNINSFRGIPVQESDTQMMSTSPVSPDEFLIRCYRHEQASQIRVANITLYISSDVRPGIFPLFFCSSDTDIPVYATTATEAGTKYSFYVRIKWPGIANLFDFFNVEEVLPEILQASNEFELPKSETDLHNVVLANGHMVLPNPQFLINRYNNQYWGCPLMQRVDQNDQTGRVVISGSVDDHRDISI